MAARRNRRGRRRNRGRFSALYKLLSVLIIFAAILMGCVVFFRVSTVEITGDSPYTEEEIRRVARRLELPVVENPCPANGHSRRQEVKELIAGLEGRYPDIKQKLFGSLQRYPLYGWNLHEEER